MIPVEEVLTMQSESAGFLIMNADTVAQDRVIFNEGKVEVLRWASNLRASSPYTWATPVKRIVDAAAGEYPLLDAMFASHHLHAQSMLWVSDDPFLMTRDHKLERDVPITAIVVGLWKKVPKSFNGSNEFLEYMRAMAIGSDEEKRAANERKRELIETATGVMFYGLSMIKDAGQVQLPIGKSGPRPRLLVPILAGSITFGSSHPVNPPNHDPDPTELSELERLQRWVLAACALLRQRILVPQRVGPTRAEIKRGVLPEQAIHTITLRSSERATSELGEESMAEWACRWIVRGHWRKQWYASADEHRVIWIPPYVKGPEDKPLVVRPSVFAVTR